MWVVFCVHSTRVSAIRSKIRRRRLSSSRSSVRYENKCITATGANSIKLCNTLLKHVSKSSLSHCIHFILTRRFGSVQYLFFPSRYSVTISAMRVCRKFRIRILHRSGGQFTTQAHAAISMPCYSNFKQIILSRT